MHENGDVQGVILIFFFFLPKCLFCSSLGITNGYPVSYPEKDIDCISSDSSSSEWQQSSITILSSFQRPYIIRDPHLATQG